MMDEYDRLFDLVEKHGLRAEIEKAQGKPLRSIYDSDVRAFLKSKGIDPDEGKEHWVPKNRF